MQGLSSPHPGPWRNAATAIDVSERVWTDTDEYTGRRRKPNDDDATMNAADSLSKFTTIF